MSSFHSLEVRDVEAETDDSVALTLDVPEPLREAFRHAPGQYLTVRASVGGEDLRRCYSICSGVDEDALRIGVRLVPGGRVSGLLTKAKPGDRLAVLPPAGRFTATLDPDSAHRYVAIAAGSGITPVLSLFRSVLDREPHSEFTLLYGNRRMDSIMFQRALGDLKDRYLDRARVFHFLSRERTAVDLFSGRVDVDKCARLLGPLDGYDRFFLCGPGAMIDEIEGGLTERGVPAARIATERFHNPGQPEAADAPADVTKPAGEVVAEVRVCWRGVERQFPMTAGQPTVLDAAIEAGLDLPFSCKAGVCCTCRAKVTAGEARMRRNYSLQPWEVESGYVLTCQAVPESGELSLDLDQT